MKYFCISEQTSYYLQKYIVIRKRKIFTGLRTAGDLIEILKKHKNEKYLFPCSSIRKDDIPEFLKENGYNHTEAVMYETVAADLSDLEDVYYDIIAFFSPSGINSLFVNFPDFKQNDTRHCRVWAYHCKSGCRCRINRRYRSANAQRPFYDGCY